MVVVLPVHPALYGAERDAEASGYLLGVLHVVHAPLEDCAAGSDAVLGIEEHNP